jgi:hypothetical protein
VEISRNDFQGADLPRRLLHRSVANGTKIATLRSVQRLEGSQQPRMRAGPSCLSIKLGASVPGFPPGSFPPSLGRFERCQVYSLVRGRRLSHQPSDRIPSRRFRSGQTLSRWRRYLIRLQWNLSITQTRVDAFASVAKYHHLEPLAPATAESTTEISIASSRGKRSPARCLSQPKGITIVTQK